MSRAARRKAGAQSQVRLAPGSCNESYHAALSLSAGRSPASSRGPARRMPPGAGQSAGDGEVVADVDDAVGHPGGADRGVVFGPGTDMAGQGDDVCLDAYL